MPPTSKVLCQCCKTYLSVSQERRHRRRGLVPSALRASSSVSGHGRWLLTEAVPSLYDTYQSHFSHTDDPPLAPSESENEIPAGLQPFTSEPPVGPELEPDIPPSDPQPPLDPFREAEDRFLTSAIHGSERHIWSERLRSRPVTVEDVEDEDDVGGPDGDEDEDEGSPEDDPEYTAISAWDMLSEDFLRKGQASRTSSVMLKINERRELNK